MKMMWLARTFYGIAMTILFCGFANVAWKTFMCALAELVTSIDAPTFPPGKEKAAWILMWIVAVSVPLFIAYAVDLTRGCDIKYNNGGDVKDNPKHLG